LFLPHSYYTYVTRTSGDVENVHTLMVITFTACPVIIHIH